jgi:hypothetical protein
MTFYNIFFLPTTTFMICCANNFRTKPRRLQTSERLTYSQKFCEFEYDTGHGSKNNPDKSTQQGERYGLHHELQQDIVRLGANCLAP